MNIKNTIKAQLCKIGQTVILKDCEWTSTPFKATIQPIRYKNKMYLEASNTPLGVANQDYYLFIGPYDHDLTKLSNECTVNVSNDKYIIVKSERVMVKDEVCYIWAVIKKLLEEDE